MDNRAQSARSLVAVLRTMHAEQKEDRSSDDSKERKRVLIIHKEEVAKCSHDPDKDESERQWEKQNARRAHPSRRRWHDAADSQGSGH